MVKPTQMQGSLFYKDLQLLSLHTIKCKMKNVFSKTKILRLPSYYKAFDAKKKCYPPEEHYTESYVEITIFVRSFNFSCTRK